MIITQENPIPDVTHPILINIENTRNYNVV